MVEPDDVVSVFRHILHRDPEASAIALYSNFESIDDLLRAIIHSPEGEAFRRPQFNACSLYYHQIDAESIIRSHEDRSRQAVEGRFVSFFGVIMNTAHLPIPEKAGMVEGLPIPVNWHADAAEFAAALRAVDLASDTFRVIELGCGWGCWLLTTAVAARRRGLTCEMIGVEGDEKHVGYARQAMAENGFAEADFRLHRAIAGAGRGRALFPRQDCAIGNTSWGLEPIIDASDADVEKAEREGGYDVLPVLGIADLLQDGTTADLLHIDIQGGEAALVEACIDDLNRRVAYMVIGTHSREIEGRLCGLLLRQGWVLEIERPMIVNFHKGLPTPAIDGVQGWRNPRLR